MGGDERVTGVGVRGGEHGVDFVHGHVQVAEPPDDLSGGDLVGGVAAIPGTGVDVGWFEQADAVVVAQGFHAQVGRPGEVTDRRRCLHDPRFCNLPLGESHGGDSGLTVPRW